MRGRPAVAPHGFVVLGAGLPRTGTNSLQLALEQLLGGTCYHMKTILQNNGDKHYIFWDKAIKRRLKKEDWVHFLNEEFPCRAGVDYPISFYWKELLDVFPDAKIILSTRRPETWRKSVKESIYYAGEQSGKFPLSVLRWFGGNKKRQVPENVTWAIPPGFNESAFGAVQAGDEEAMRFFKKWQEDVIATVPPERLLVFEAKQGWEPLCDFLGLPVPDGPFPRVNDTAEMRSRIDSLKRMAYGIIFAAPVVGAVAVYAGWALARNMWSVADV